MSSRGGGYVKNDYIPLYFKDKKKHIVFVFDYENFANRTFREYSHHKLLPFTHVYGLVWSKIFFFINFVFCFVLCMKNSLI
jgi:hypothetical protein